VWYVEALARALGITLTEDKKAFGLTGQTAVDGRTLRLLIPTTWMNRSGQATSAVANFFKIPPEAMLVAHDELDLPPGTLRLKQGGGHGGHNGLRDIVQKLGTRDFLRIRLGVGRPEHGDVTNHVLGAFQKDEKASVDEMVAQCCDAIEVLLSDGLARAQNRFH
jgi:PTH1 family peptidyl-tRNA hydrolase